MAGEASRDTQENPPGGPPRDVGPTSSLEGVRVDSTENQGIIGKECSQLR